MKKERSISIGEGETGRKEFVTSNKLVKLLSPILGLQGRAIRKLTINVSDLVVTIDVTEYIRTDPANPAAQPDLELLDRLIAFIEEERANDLPKS